MLIINEIEKTKVLSYQFGWNGVASAIGIFLYLALIGMVVLTIYGIKIEGWHNSLFFILIILFGIIVYFLCFQVPAETKEYTEYQLSLKDSDIPLNEFLSKYEIVKQDGNILIFVEKDDS